MHEKNDQFLDYISFLVATQRCECKNRKISTKKAGFGFEKIFIGKKVILSHEFIDSHHCFGSLNVIIL